VPPTRRYASAIRTEQTLRARRRILAVAGQLFVRRGYLGTTLAAVATAADVSVQTVYNVVGGKPALLKAVYDVTLAGDDEPVPMAERPAFRAMLDATDGRDLLAQYAHLGRLLSERTLPLVTTVLAQAATGDADLAAFADTIEDERAIGTRATARLVADRFGLREGLGVDEAADVLWAVTAPDLTDRLVNRRGWSWDSAERLIADLMASALLGDR
jgi:AcrR family transcriptional regulator